MSIYINIYTHTVHGQAHINGAKLESRIADSDMLMNKVAVVSEEAVAPTISDVDIQLLKQALENPMFKE